MGQGINLTSSAKTAQCGPLGDPSHVESLRAMAAEAVPANAGAPPTASSPGTPGQLAYDATHVYICIAANTWVRATTATF